MSTIRRIFLFFSAFVLLITLLVTAYVWTVNTTVTDREVVLSWIEDSGFYDTISAEALQTIESEVLEVEQEAVETEVLVRAAERVLTPENLQAKLEPVLNAVYDWLEGDAERLEFVIELAAEKAALAKSFTDEATARLQALPTCEGFELTRLQGVSVFEMVCKPPELEQTIDEFYAQFLTDNDFLPDERFTAEDIMLTVDGVEQTLATAASEVPTWYQFARTVAWMLLLMSGILVLIVVFLSKNIRYGLKHTGMVFVIASVLIFSSALGATLGSSSLNVSGDTFGEAIAVPLAQQSLDSAAIRGYTIAAIYMLVFIGVSIYLTATRRKHEEAIGVYKTADDGHVDDTKKVEKSKTPEPKKENAELDSIAKEPSAPTDSDSSQNDDASDKLKNS